MAKVFSGAYVKSIPVQNAMTKFHMPGIWPYNPHVFGDKEFVLATTSDPLMSSASFNATDTKSLLQ